MKRTYPTARIEEYFTALAAAPPIPLPLDKEPWVLRNERLKRVPDAPPPSRRHLAQMENFPHVFKGVTMPIRSLTPVPAADTARVDHRSQPNNPLNSALRLSLAVHILGGSVMRIILRQIPSIS
jgi:hypothetical protein